MVKKIVKFFALALVIAMTVQVPAFAKYTYSNKMHDGKSFYHTYYLYVNSKEIKTPTMTYKTTYLRDIAYVPLKAIITAMGDNCTISGNKATVTEKNNTKIVMQANSNKLTINGKTEQFMYRDDDWDGYSYYSPLIKNGIYYVPIDAHFSRIFGYELHKERTEGPSTSKSVSETYNIYIGKAPARFYVKSVYPFIYQYQIPTKPSATANKLKILPKADFSKVNKSTTTKDPLKDYLHFRETLPYFKDYVPSSYPGYSTEPASVVEKRYGEDLASGKFKYDNLSFAYDAYGIYNLEMSNVRVGLSKKGVLMSLNSYDYISWGEYEGSLITDVYDFNTAAAVNSILRYYMPNEGGVLFSRLYNEQFHWNEPVKYTKDKCTVTFRNTTGPFVIDIEWN
jgi:hypothetical protein